MELLKLETGMNIVHVPYKGAAGALADVVGGHVQATIAAVQTAQPHVLSGKLRGIGVMSAERSQAFPEVPTLKEQGLPQLEVETWYGAFAPAGTPAGVVAKINSDLNLLLQDFRHPEYPQLWGPFVKNLSSIDLLLNVGEGGSDLIRGAGGTRSWPS